MYMMDLFVGFDHRALVEESRDLTTFQTLLSTFCLTLVCSGLGDESGSGAEKPKHLPLNVMGLVQVVDC